MVETSKSRSLAQIVLVSVLFSGLFLQSEGANILFFIGFGGPSHRIAAQPLADGLSAKGHNVTILTQDPPKDANSSKINYFTPKKNAEFFVNLILKGNVDHFQLRSLGIVGSIAQRIFIQSFGVKLCENLNTDPDYVEWVKSNKFDLVIIDTLFNECAHGIAYVHNAKTIILSISTLLPWVIEPIGIPDETSFIPDAILGFGPDMSFFNRAVTGVFPVVWRILRHWYYWPRLTQSTREGLGRDDIPNLGELEKNTSLVLVNTHPSQEFPRSLPPNVIAVGGLSWVQKEKKALPKHFEDFINQGKEGFVYISFGSFIDFLRFPAEIQNKFINTLWRFPHIQFIWKLNKVPDNLPKNVLIEKWMPQQDLLSHPKIRAFVSHAGIGGVNEAIYGNVPLVLFPILTEQDYNAHIAQAKGFGIRMEITTLTEGVLEEALTKILTDESYKTTMKKVNSQFRDRPMGGLESAIWWVEYTLRQDTSFLRPLNVQQCWWQKRQLDVWLFVLVSVVGFNLVVGYILYKLLKMCFGSKKTAKPKQKQN